MCPLRIVTVIGLALNDNDDQDNGDTDTDDGDEEEREQQQEEDNADVYDVVYGDNVIMTATDADDEEEDVFHLGISIRLI